MRRARRAIAAAAGALRGEAPAPGLHARHAASKACACADGALAPAARPAAPPRRHPPPPAAAAAAAAAARLPPPATWWARGLSTAAADAAGGPAAEFSEADEALFDDGDGDASPSPLRPGVAVRLPLAPGAPGLADWTVETGRLARMADGAALLRAGDTVVLAAVVCDSGGAGAGGPGDRQARRDALLLPLEVDHRERLAAAGRIPGSYNKREGGPGRETEVLAARRLDRALRPLFPRGFVADLAVSTQLLAAGRGADPDVAAVAAASAALMVSDVPFGGPVAAARVSLLPGGGLTVNAPPAEAAAAEATVFVAATAERVTTLEVRAGPGLGVPEARVAEALRAGASAARALLPAQAALGAAAGRRKRSLPLAGADPAARARVDALARPAVAAILRDAALGKAGRGRALARARADAAAALRAAGAWRAEHARVPGSGCVSQPDLDAAFTAALGAELAALALREGLRPDGRGPVDVRPSAAEVDAVPVVHGSALFERGETQVLATATVGARGEAQRVEGLDGDAAKRLAVHYAFPPYAVRAAAARRGAAGGGGGRREAGHSALVEAALAPVLPPEADFPFVLRLNADTLASNGSSSMAAVCGGALALADAGVPLRALVAGVAVGLAAEGAAWAGDAGAAGGGPPGATLGWPPLGRHELLTDLQGLEDALGGMDLKVAGTAAGVTAAQLDVKVPGGVPLEVVEAALAEAARARRGLLATMEAAAAAAAAAHGGGRAPHAPRFGTMRVPEALVGRVIGPAGAGVRAIEAATGARLDCAPEGGLIHLFAPSAGAYAAARARVAAATGADLRVGGLYEGTVVALRDFGAFVELPGSDVHALLHVSEVAPHRIRAVEDELRLGQRLDVVLTSRDARGGLKVSRKAALARQKQPQLPPGGGNSSPAPEP